MEAEWTFFSVWSSVLNREPLVSMLCIAIQVTRERGEDLHDILVHLVLDADHSDDMYNYIYIYAAMPIYWITCIQYTLYIHIIYILYIYYIYYIYIYYILYILYTPFYTLYIYIHTIYRIKLYIHTHTYTFNNIKLVMIYRRHVMHCTDRKKYEQLVNWLIRLNFP